MAQRVEDAGVGRWLNKLKFTSEELKETSETMLQEEEMSFGQKNIKRVQAITKLHGGVKRAVDLIEMAGEYGTKLFVPINNSYPWYAYYDLDIYAIWLLTCIGLKRLIVHCYYRCRTTQAEKNKKENFVTFIERA